MKDEYKLLPMRINRSFDDKPFILNTTKIEASIDNPEDLLNANFIALEGSGIFDTILNIGRKLMSSLIPLSKTVSDVGKVVDSGSEVYRAVRDFTKPKTAVEKKVEAAVKKVVPKKPKEGVLEEAVAEE